MTKEGTKPEPKIVDRPTTKEIYAPEFEDNLARQQIMEKIRLLTARLAV